jgi:hypothetical protein
MLPHLTKSQTDNESELDQSAITAISVATLQGNPVLVLAVVENDRVLSRYVVDPSVVSTARAEIKALALKILETM